MSKTTIGILSCCVLALAGCEASRGGAGQTTTGQPVVAEIRQDSNLQQSFTITSVSGWQCAGILTSEQRNNFTSSVITVPLACNTGMSGTSLVAIDRVRGKLDINFRLKDGTVGNAKIG
jgi:hypothetical protein